MKRAIFFDIDGTLVQSGHKTVPDSTLLALQKAKEGGHLLYINTGRTLAELNDYHFSLPFDGYICGCGTLIYEHGKKTFKKGLSSTLQKSILEDVKQYHLPFALEGDEYIYFPDKDIPPELEHLFHYFKKAMPERVTSPAKHPVDFSKLVLFLTNDSNLPAFQEKYKQELDFIKRDSTFYEVIPKNHSKATGIQKILDAHQMSLDQAIAIGDSSNDISMLSYVPHSVAMGNSDQALFDLVDFITTDIDDDGIYHALEHYNVI